jgi:hypothetical protein
MGALARLRRDRACTGIMFAAALERDPFSLKRIALYIFDLR